MFLDENDHLRMKDTVPIVIKEPTYRIAGSLITPITYSGTFKYLGIQFNPNGKISINTSDLKSIIERVSKAPLKPYQKLEVLRCNIIPKLFHRLMLGKITKGLLDAMDNIVRKFVKNVLDLPDDIPNSFLYSRFKDGGLGIPKFVERVPITLLRRVSKFCNNSDPVIVSLAEQDRIKSLMEKCRKIINTYGTNSPSVDTILNIHKSELHKKIDGKPLCELKDNHQGQLWITGLQPAEHSRT